MQHTTNAHSAQASRALKYDASTTAVLSTRSTLLRHRKTLTFLAVAIFMQRALSRASNLSPRNAHANEAVSIVVRLHNTPLLTAHGSAALRLSYLGKLELHVGPCRWRWSVTVGSSKPLILFRLDFHEHRVLRLHDLRSRSFSGLEPLILLGFNPVQHCILRLHDLRPYGFRLGLCGG